MAEAAPLANRAGSVPPAVGGGWPARYTDLAQELMVAAPHARPLLISSTINIDEIYAMGTDRLTRLLQLGKTHGGLAAELARAVHEQLKAERDGELFWDWPTGARWVGDALGPPDRRQVGGTGPQAAWALDVLGARSVMALRRRHHEQLSVLPGDVLVCRGGLLVPVRTLAATDDVLPSKHEILEFSRGTPVAGRALGRSHRLILRFAAIALEVDDEFLAMQEKLSATAGAALLSGLNGLAVADRDSLDWAVNISRAWKNNGVALRHLELGDTRRPGEFREVLGHLRGLCSSVGLSLSELQGLWGPVGDVGAKAVELASALDCPCIVVHADHWSLAVHRGERDAMLRRLMAGNLLASARASLGVPHADLVPPDGARYSTDLPSSGVVADGWWADCAPVPHIAQPLSTIGLGDTFVAGLLLAGALEQGGPG